MQRSAPVRILLLAATLVVLVSAAPRAQATKDLVDVPPPRLPAKRWLPPCSPKADLDALMKGKAKLSAVLQYHVLTGNVSTADLKMMKDFGTAQGGQ